MNKKFEFERIKIRKLRLEFLLGKSAGLKIEPSNSTKIVWSKPRFKVVYSVIHLVPVHYEASNTHLKINIVELVEFVIA